MVVVLVAVVFTFCGGERPRGGSSGPRPLCQCPLSLRLQPRTFSHPIYRLQELYFLIYSGTIYLYECAIVLIRARYFSECIALLGWCVLAMESTLTLCDVKWLPWRTRLYRTICICYENMAEWGHAHEVCAGMARGGKPCSMVWRRVARSWSPPPPQGCIRREAAAEAAPEAVRQAVGGDCRSGWGRLLSVTNAIEAGR